MKRLVLVLSSFSLLACGGSSSQVQSSDGAGASSRSGFQIKAPTQGSTVDRLMTMQESFFGIIGNAQTAEQAAAGIDAYCAENAEAVARTLSEQEENFENEKMRDEFMKRSAKLMERAESLFGDRPGFADDELIVAAMERCKPQD